MQCALKPACDDATARVKYDTLYAFDVFLQRCTEWPFLTAHNMPEVMYVCGWEHVAPSKHPALPRLSCKASTYPFAGARIETGMCDVFQYLL